MYIKKNISRGTRVIHGVVPDFIWVELNKSFFRLEENIYIGFVYLPPVNSSVNINQEVQAFEYLENDICKLKEKGSIVLIGDTNSRIGTFNDFILNDDDKHSPVPDAYVSDENENLLNRHNEDISSVNTYGRRLLDLCKDHEMRILNGRTIGCFGKINML